ncbi:hypothetical protein ACQP26_24700 [Micromonospora sp. CA-248089]|uniref:hypothetical protein n=1 Tax=Micromonospora sp. CA-248089 TaxID=3239960 RepID=UPI003D950513
MSVDDQPGLEQPSTEQGRPPTPASRAEALRQIARDMAKAYEVALEVDPQLYFSGRSPVIASAYGSAERA